MTSLLFLSRCGTSCFAFLDRLLIPQSGLILKVRQINENNWDWNDSSVQTIPRCDFVRDENLLVCCVKAKAFHPCLMSLFFFPLNSSREGNIFCHSGGLAYILHSNHMLAPSAAVHHFSRRFVFNEFRCYYIHDDAPLQFGSSTGRVWTCSCVFHKQSISGVWVANMWPASTLCWQSENHLMSCAVIAK